MGRLVPGVPTSALSGFYSQSLGIPGNIPGHSPEPQSMAIHVGSDTRTLMRASCNRRPAQGAPKAQEGPEAQKGSSPTTQHVLGALGGCKSERQQPALKDEMPLRKKGKENKRLLVQPKGNQHCHHRRSTSKASKAPEKVTLGGRRWGIAFRAQVSFCYLRTVPEGR